MKFNFTESGRYTIRKTIEAGSREEAEQVYEDWKYGGEFPEDLQFEEYLDRDIDEVEE
ncbi:hypothetical protein [Anaerococcus sp. Marseille-P3915]|uniref:hypothetical protein n=1 Tax=Anaerococcus sp. Marseille-P3915 TaxID=2057799 RepID=UPI00131A2BAD|nr:hypothetical protein [Anaerococcus sp. Marseille-P3915]